MTSLQECCSPILTCEAARDLERTLFQGNESLEWAAMQAAGRSIARRILLDAGEIGGLAASARVLVLVGKGHNGGDALIAAAHLLQERGDACADVHFVFGERALRPLALRAWRELQTSCGARVNVRSDLTPASSAPGYDVGLDGIFGFQFRPPADAVVAARIATVNASPIRLRAAVDLPSAGLFRADFTYATGSVKAPVLAGGTNSGRVRYLDLGFFASAPSAKTQGQEWALTSRVLDPLRDLRPADSDKRTFGHVFLVGGSRSFPGAILMTALAAARSGAGLVTAFVPEFLVPAYAARAPEVMWVGCPEAPGGGLALEGEHLVRERSERADVLVMGPGAAREPETLALFRSLVATARVPVVLDADALQRETIAVVRGPAVVTPHAGEFKRIAGETGLREFAAGARVTTVLKGPVTRLCDGGAVFHSFGGGPVLARGGSGDVLAGMIGAQLARWPEDPLLAAARAVVWHGAAAESLARAHGQVAVLTTQLLDHLGPALRRG